MNGIDRSSAGHTKPSRLDQLSEQMQGSAERLAMLRMRAREELQEDAIVLEAFQALDSAHEELRVAEEHLHSQVDAIQLAHNVREAELRLYADLFDSAPESYLVTNLAGTITAANRRAIALLNIDKRFLVGKPLLGFLHEGDRNHLPELLRSLAGQERLVNCVLRFQPRRATDFKRMHVSACRSADGIGLAVTLRWLIREAQDERPVPPAPKRQRASLAREIAVTKVLIARALRRGQNSQRRFSSTWESKYLALRSAKRDAGTLRRALDAWLDAVSKRDPR